MATVGEKEAETSSPMLLARRNRETASQSPKNAVPFKCFGGSCRPVIPVVVVLCILFSMKDAKSDIPRRRAGTKVKFLYVSCLPSFLPLVFYHILPELFLSMGS